jgi:hypothetical protein
MYELAGASCDISLGTALDPRTCCTVSDRHAHARRRSMVFVKLAFFAF